MTEANSMAIEAWNTFLFDKFNRFRHLVTKGLANHGNACLERHRPAPGARVLDIGCGFGDTTIDIANMVGPDGLAFGIDAAARFIDVGINDAREAGVAQAQFGVADAESDALGGPYDLAFTRFGVMFFANPVAAMRNVRRALKPGGKIAWTVWRKREDNPWLHDVEQRVLSIMPHPEETPDQITCGPGPFSMAGADLVSAQLKAAGFTQITFERFDADICIGRNVQEALAFATAIGPAGEILRLAGAEGEAKRPQVETALRDLFASKARADGVFNGSSSWIISATA